MATPEIQTGPRVQALSVPAPGCRCWGWSKVSASLLAVIVDCRDPRDQAEFWARVLAYKVSQRNPDEFLVSDRAGAGGSLYFMKVPEGAVNLPVDCRGPGSDSEPAPDIGKRLVDSAVPGV